MCGRPLPWGRSKASKSWPRPAAAWTRSSTSCATLSLSPRVNDILMNLRVGQPLDFEFEFGQEMPQNADLRKRLFLELAQEGGNRERRSGHRTRSHLQSCVIPEPAAEERLRAGGRADRRRPCAAGGAGLDRHAFEPMAASLAGPPAAD